MEWKTKGGDHNHSNSHNNQHKMLRPQLSKIAITGLEFSEALPFAAFASLLVETVAKLDLVIDEVEELGRMACFGEFKENSENNNNNSVTVKCETPRINVVQNQLPSHGAD